MNKNRFIISFLCLFFSTSFAVAQIELAASSSQGSTTTTGNGVNWTSVVATTFTPNVGTSVTKVLVEATIEAEVTSGNSNIESIFRLTDGTSFSRTISRYVATKTYDDKGIVAISYIFEYSPAFTTPKTFTLQHTKTTSGASKQFTSNAVITAIEIASDNVILPNNQGTAASVSTTSATYNTVATASINLVNAADIYVITTFSTAIAAGSNVLGGWAIADNSSIIGNTEITRTIIDPTSIGAATIVTLIENVPAGIHNFTLEHKSDGINTLETTEVAISAVAFTSTSGEIFPTFSSLNDTGTSTTNTYTDLASATITAPNNGFSNNKLFMHASFNMSATIDNIVYATYQFTSTATFTSFEIERYVPNGNTGSGGLVALVIGINEGSSFNVGFQHKNSGASGTLTSNKVNNIGLFLNSDPNATLSVEENILSTNITVYPNPSRDYCIIHNNVTDGETLFKFYTLTGQLVHTVKADAKTNTKIDITGWATGVYILKANHKGINIAKNLIVD
jgi:hypothetical protein